MTPEFIDLQAGQKVSVIGAGAPSSASSYPSTVRAVHSNRVDLSIPVRDGDELELSPGTSVLIYVELHGRLYTFNSAVQDSPAGGARLLFLDMPRAASRTDRREYYRLDTSISPAYAAHINDDRDELERIDVVIMDLSGGGVQLRSKQPVEPGSLVRLIFALDGEIIDMDLTALVLSSLPEVRTSQFRLHARYSGTARSVEERIVRYVFREQVDRLKRGVA